MKAGSNVVVISTQNIGSRSTSARVYWRLSGATVLTNGPLGKRSTRISNTISATESVVAEELAVVEIKSAGVKYRYVRLIIKRNTQVVESGFQRLYRTIRIHYSIEKQAAICSEGI